MREDMEFLETLGMRRYQMTGLRYTGRVKKMRTQITLSICPSAAYFFMDAVAISQWTYQGNLIFAPAFEDVFDIEVLIGDDSLMFFLPTGDDWFLFWNLSSKTEDYKRFAKRIMDWHKRGLLRPGVLPEFLREP